MSAKNTVIAAWKMAVINRPFDQELLFHSDRGIQYACNAFIEIFKSYSGLVKQSMSRKGNCWDNAVSESFFKTIKVEWIHKHNYVNRKNTELSIFHWIETWYNKKRRHSALGYKNIDEIENIIHMFNQAA